MIEQLRDEINLIQTQEIKEFAEEALRLAPKYFWEKPSSSTGKYHPKQSLGFGGLVNHIRSCVYFAQVFIRAYTQEPYILRNSPKDDRMLTKRQADHIIAAVLLHDVLKYGIDEQKHTTKNHDKDGATFVRTVAAHVELPKEDMLAIAYPVLYHMGQWSHKSVPYKSIVDYTIPEMIVHLADMTSAAKDVHLNFLEPLDDNFCG